MATRAREIAHSARQTRTSSASVIRCNIFRIGHIKGYKREKEKKNALGTFATPKSIDSAMLSMRIESLTLRWILRRSSNRKMLQKGTRDAWDRFGGKSKSLALSRTNNGEEKFHADPELRHHNCDLYDLTKNHVRGLRPL
jgi:hypothetical protein